MSLQSIPFRRVAAVTLALAVCVAAPKGQAGPFTPGNVVVVRLGDSQSGLDDSARPVTLVEYSPSGGPEVNTVTIPSSSGGQLTDRESLFD
jgi:hypothetical protein